MGNLPIKHENGQCSVLIQVKKKKTGLILSTYRRTCSIYIYIHIYICVCVCVYIYMYIYISYNIRIYEYNMYIQIVEACAYTSHDIHKCEYI
jgi:hypothetical protein